MIIISIALGFSTGTAVPPAPPLRQHCPAVVIYPCSGACYTNGVSDDTPSFAEEFLAKIMPALIRSGDIREATILSLADQLDREAAETLSADDEEKLLDMATMLRAYTIEASAPPFSASQDRADKRRRRFRVIEGPFPPSV